MSLDDIAALFAPAPTAMGADSKIVQGTILTFSTINGANTVNVNGATLTNVPMLLTGAEVNYAPKDPVLLLLLGNTYMLMGKVASVGSPRFASASIATASASSGATGFALTPTFVALAACSVTVPSWANTALVTAIGTVSLGPSTASATAAMNTGLTGISFPSQVNFSVLSGGYSAGAQGETKTVTGLSGGSTIQAEVDGASSPGTASATFNQATIRMSAIFYKQ